MGKLRQPLETVLVELLPKIALRDTTSLPEKLLFTSDDTSFPITQYNNLTPSPNVLLPLLIGPFHVFGFGPGPFQGTAIATLRIFRVFPVFTFT